MERGPDTTASPETILVEKYRMTAGSKVVLEKIAMHSASTVPVGAVLEGVLDSDVKIGSPITFSDSPASVSDVKNIEEQEGQLYIHTRTSTYVLRPERAPENPEDFTWDDVEMVETAKGSTYRYLPDGTTQRFKKVEGREEEPQDALVYVPPFSWIKQHATPEELEKLGQEDKVYLQTLLEYVHNFFQDGRKVYIVDATGKRVETNHEIKNTEGQIYLEFRKGGKADFYIPVSHKPVVGYYTFDIRTYDDKQTGENMRERHFGNAVVKITLKQKKGDLRNASGGHNKI